MVRTNPRPGNGSFSRSAIRVARATIRMTPSAVKRRVTWSAARNSSDPKIST